jgi:hypothetical protein
MYSTFIEPRKALAPITAGTIRTPIDAPKVRRLGENRRWYSIVIISIMRRLGCKIRNAHPNDDTCQIAMVATRMCIGRW